MARYTYLSPGAGEIVRVIRNQTFTFAQDSTSLRYECKLNVEPVLNDYAYADILLTSEEMYGYFQSNPTISLTHTSGITGLLTLSCPTEPNIPTDHSITGDIIIHNVSAVGNVSAGT